VSRPKGGTLTPEHRKAISEGVKRSYEKYDLKQARVKMTPAVRKKIAATQKARWLAIKQTEKR